MKRPLCCSKCKQLSAAYFLILSSSFILNAPLTPIFSTISPHYICCFLPTSLMLDFFYLNKWLISTFHHHLPFLYLPLKIPLLFLFFLYFLHCLLLPLHSPINSSLILLFKTHLNGEGQTLPFLFLFSIIFSIL